MITPAKRNPVQTMKNHANLTSFVCIKLIHEIFPTGPVFIGVSSTANVLDTMNTLPIIMASFLFFWGWQESGGFAGG